MEERTVILVRTSPSVPESIVAGDGATYTAWPDGRIRLPAKQVSQALLMSGYKIVDEAS